MCPHFFRLFHLADKQSPCRSVPLFPCLGGYLEHHSYLRFIRGTEQWNRWDFHQRAQQCFNLKAFAAVTDTGKCPRHASNCCCSEPWVQFLLPSMRPGRFTSLSLALCDPPDSIRSLILRIHVIKFGLKHFNVWALSSSCTYHCLLNQGRGRRSDTCDNNHDGVGHGEVVRGAALR